MRKIFFMGKNLFFIVFYFQLFYFDSFLFAVKKLLLDYQSVTSGLFPRYSKDQQIGYVKDSIYAAFACWACSLAYKLVSQVFFFSKL